MQLKGLLYYSFINMKYSLIIFWSIMCGILLLTIGADLLFSSENTSFYFDFSFPIYIFAGIMGFWVVKNMIPYIIKLGSTRMNVFIGTGIALLLLAVLNAVIASTIKSLVAVFYSKTTNGVVSISTGEEASEQFYFSHIIDLFGENTWLNRFIIDFTISFFFIAVMFVLSLIFYRYHLIGGFAFLAIVMFCMIFAIAKGWVWDFIVNVLSDFSIVFFYELFVTGLIVYLLSYLLLKRITV